MVNGERARGAAERGRRRERATRRPSVSSSSPAAFPAPRRRFPSRPPAPPDGDAPRSRSARTARRSRRPARAARSSDRRRARGGRLAGESSSGEIAATSTPAPAGQGEEVLHTIAPGPVPWVGESLGNTTCGAPVPGQPLRIAGWVHFPAAALRACRARCPSRTGDRHGQHNERDRAGEHEQASHPPSMRRPGEVVREHGTDGHGPGCVLRARPALVR